MTDELKWRPIHWLWFGIMAAAALAGAMGYAEPHHTLTLLGMVAVILVIDSHAAVTENNSSD